MTTSLRCFINSFKAFGTLTVDGGNIVFNEDSANQDFRVESNGQTHMLFVDGGNDRVMIGSSTAPHQKLSITGVSGSADGNLANGILALTTGSGGINDTRMLFGIVDDNYGLDVYRFCNDCILCCY